jgi:type I restriction enzyme M protein
MIKSRSIMQSSQKESERAELHRTIWAIANDLRGSVDGWDFKAYVLGFLFYRFISENLISHINDNMVKSKPNFDYRKISDKKASTIKDVIVQVKGFFILPSELFSNVNKNDKDLNITLTNIFKNIENSATGTKSENDIKGLFDDIDLDSNKLGSTVEKRNELLKKLLMQIGNLKFSNFKDNVIDTFGDAYEYLMTMYAASAGKSGGEFFTPQEVSELIARLTLIKNDSKLKTKVNKVYDPACGSGSLLLKFSKILGKDNILDGFFGQEINLTTYNLARINMFLHDINYEKFNLKHGDTLTNPMHLDNAPFDAIVSNPPYSIKWDGADNPSLRHDERFIPAGTLAPKSKADLAFVMHMLYLLSANGTAAIVEFPGVLYRGGAEQKIRQYLVDNNYVDTVIQLPPDLFFGTSIATCIIVLKKNKRTNDVLFVDASDQFIHSGNKNKLTDKNISNIFNIVQEFKDVNYIAKRVEQKDIKENDYNLTVSMYIQKEDLSEKIDIDKLENELKEIVKRENKLRIEIDKIVKELR